MRRTATAVSMTALLLVAACAPQTMDDLERFTAEAHRDRRPSVEPLPELQPYRNFIYAAAHLVDPFDTANLGLDQPEPEPGGPAPDMDRRREVLEQYTLDSLRMVGTLSRGETTWAILRAPDNTVHQASVGNYLGTNFGRITAISEARVEVTETIQGPTGGWIERQASLALP